MVDEIEFPETVLSKLNEAAKKLERPLDEMKQLYLDEFFNDDFVRNDPQFTDDDLRHQYAIGFFWKEIVLRPPTQPYSLVPIGASNVLAKKSTGIPFATLFVLDNKGKLSSVSLSGDDCKLTTTISYMNLYEDVQLSKSKESNVFFADDRTNFDNPQPMDEFDPKSIITQLELQPHKIAELPENLSRTDEKGYAERLDWRCLRALIKYPGRYKNEVTGYEDGSYVVADESIDPKHPVLPSGLNIGNGIRVRVHPTLMKYPKDSECYFLGPAYTYHSDKLNTDILSMDGYCVIPIIIAPSKD